MQSESQSQKSRTDIAFPWEHVPLGGGFFVPTLNPQRTIEKAHRAAMTARVFHFKSIPCIINGKLGVYFQRLRR
jgi:hypothetical protein